MKERKMMDSGAILGDIVHVKFTLDLPRGKWLTNFSFKYPDLTFSIFSMLPLDENLGNTLIKIQGSMVELFLDEFMQLDSQSFTCNVLFKGEDNVVLDVRTNEPIILKALQKLNIPIKYPVMIQEGKATIELLSQREKIDSLLTALEKLEIHSSINRIGPYSPSRILSPRQGRVLEYITANGYFDVPRKKSLSRLADDLGISPSTLSQNLRRIFKKLARAYLTG